MSGIQYSDLFNFLISNSVTPSLIHSNPNNNNQTLDFGTLSGSHFKHLSQSSEKPVEKLSSKASLDFSEPKVREVFIQLLQQQKSCVSKSSSKEEEFDIEDMDQETEQSHFYLSTGFQQFNLPNVDCTLSLDEISDTLKRTGVLQIRPIPENSTILVIGCGNRNEYRFGQGDDFSEFQNAHTHEGMVTINEDISWNPTIMGKWGEQEFPMLKRGQFKKVIMENRSEMTKIAKKELNRILAPGGVVVNANGEVINF